MATPGWIELFIGPLEGLRLPYMVTGSIDRGFLDAELRTRGLDEAWRRATGPD